jgi:prepilin-type N-terminal cleavage/methylation domain-containing protein
MLRHDRSQKQDGFTLIEMVVALILLAVLLAVVSKFVIDGLTGANRSMSYEKALRMVDVAENTMTSDLRSTRARHRTTEWLRTPDDARVAILYQREAIGYLNNGDQVRLDVHDIVRADSRRFIFQSDIHTENRDSDGKPIPECVSYVSATSDGKWSLQRIVASYDQSITRGCRAGGVRVLDRSVLIAPVDVELLDDPDYEEVFSYSREHNPTDLARPGAYDGKTMPDIRPTCDREPYVGWNTSPDTRLLDQITSVSVDASNLVATVNGTHNTQDMRFAVAVRTRQQFDYMYALGCIQ